MFYCICLTEEPVEKLKSLFASNDAHFSRPRKSAAKANTARGKNGIIHAMNNRDKTALSLALAIVGGIAAGMRCWEQMGTVPRLLPR